MKTLLAVLFLSVATTLFGASSVPYVSTPTNSPQDTYIVGRTGGTGGHNKWVPYANITNTATNIIIRPGAGITVATNIVGVDYTVGSLWNTNSADGSITNMNGSAGIISIADGATVVAVDNLGGGAGFYQGRTNGQVLFGVAGNGDITRIKAIQYLWPATNSADGQYLRRKSPGGQLFWGDPVAGVAAGTNIVLTTNGTTITVNVANTNLPVVSAGTNVTVTTNGLNYTVSSSDSLWRSNAYSGGITNVRGPVGVTNNLYLLGPGSIIFTNGVLAGSSYWNFSQVATDLRLGNDLAWKFNWFPNGSFSASNFVTPTNISAVGNVLIATNTSGQSVWGSIPVGVDNLWTNDLDGPYRILRPVDQTRMVESYSIGTNYRAAFFLLNDTNPATLYTVGTYLQNQGTNTGTGSLFHGNGNYGAVGESSGNNGVALIAGDGVGVAGLADSGFGLQYGVQGMATAQYNGQTNVGAAFSATSNGKAGTTNVGLYVETQTGTVDPAISQSAVILADTRSTTNPIFIGRSNGVVVASVDNKGDLTRIKDVPYSWPATNASAGQGLASDGGSPQQLYWTNFGSGTGGQFVSAGTNITLVTNSGVVTISVSTNPVVIAGTNVTIQTNGLSYTINSTGGGGGGVGPGTARRLAMFDSTTTNVTDSLLIHSATNEIDMRMTNTSFSAVQSNLIYGAYTNATGWRATSLSVDPEGYTRIDQLLGSAVTPATFPRVGMIFNAAWLINGYGSSATGDGGGKTPDLLPIIDNAFSVGSGSSKVKFFYAGTTGYLFPDGGNVEGASYRQTFNAGGVYWYQKSGPNQVLSLVGNATLNLGSTRLAAAAGQNDNYDTYMLRGFQGGAWQFGTNNSSGTAQPTAYLHGGKANGTDKPGDKIYLASGPSTGTGTPGAVGIATAEAATTTGSSDNTSYYARYYVSPKVITLTTNADTLVFNFTIPTALRSAGGIVHAHTEIRDATDIASIDEQFAISALRKGATVTCTNSVSGPISGLATGTAGMTTTWTVVPNGQSVDVKCKVVTTGIDATTVQTRGTFFLNSSAVPLITW